MFCQECYETVTRTIETSCRMWCACDEGNEPQWLWPKIESSFINAEQKEHGKRLTTSESHLWEIIHLVEWARGACWAQERSRFCNSTDRFLLEFNVHYCLKFMVMSVCRRVPRTWVKQRGYAPACLWKATKMSWNRFTEAVRQLQLNSTWAQ